MFPVAILLWLQVKFLPAHIWIITASQRWAICTDLFLLWLFSWYVRPLNIPNPGRLRWFFKRTQALIRVFLGFVATVCIVFFSFEIAVAPKIPLWWYEISRDLPSWSNRIVLSIPRALEVSRKTLVAEAPPPEVLAAYHQRGESTDSAWLEQSRGLDLTGRDLRLADFERSRLWNADLRDARLDGAILIAAELRGVLFTRREALGGPVFYSPTVLSEADLSQVNFPKGDLSNALLVFSKLHEGKFPDADLREAKLVGAWARLVDLRGAALARVQASGADFLGADLRAADLRGANLQAADLSSAKLQGADLRGAKLQGADFRRAKLQGADLRGAVVFGTRFDKADLTLADLRGITSQDPRRDTKTLIEGLIQYRPYRATALLQYHHTLKQIRSRLVRGSEAISLQKVEHRGAIFDSGGTFSLWGDSITPEMYESKLTPELASLACDDVYIAKGLLWERPDHPQYERESLLPRVLFFDTLGADPILLRRSAALVEGLETRKCRALQQLSGPSLDELKAFVKGRWSITKSQVYGKRLSTQESEGE